MLAALGTELASVSLGNFRILVSEAVDFTYAVGDVGDVRPDPVSPGSMGNGTVRVLACESTTAVRLGVADFLQISVSRLSAIKVATSRVARGCSIIDTSQSQIHVTGILPGAHIQSNGGLRSRWTTSLEGH